MPPFRMGNTAAKKKRPGRLALTTQQRRARNLRQKEKEEKEAHDEAAAAIAAEAAAVGTPAQASARSYRESGLSDLQAAEGACAR